MGVARPRVLFLPLEPVAWAVARHHSYSAQLAFEEGFAAAGLSFLTITTPWFRRAREICAGRRFDQVWVEIARHESLDEDWLEWVASLAPVRVGLMAESLEYSAEEAAMWDELKHRKAKAQSRLRFMTHVLACDERDVEQLSGMPAMWWPQAVPRRFIREPTAPPRRRAALFCGGVYGVRQQWLQDPRLRGLLAQQPSPEKGTPYPALFDELSRNAQRFARRAYLPGCRPAHRVYVSCLRWIRRRCFARWLASLEAGCAVVNLPALLKTYAGRVVEGMAAGRPVISWEIPDRPRVKRLFEDGTEILLFPKHSPEVLAEQIERVLRDPGLAEGIAARARQKILRYHTVEERVRQILAWVEAGDPPSYG